MLLLHTPHNIGSLKLVVQPFLNLGVSILAPRPIHSLQLKSYSFLLSSNNIFPCRGIGLASLSAATEALMASISFCLMPLRAASSSSSSLLIAAVQSGPADLTTPVRTTARPRPT